MSHSEFSKATFASAREWRRMRAMIAAGVRHGHDDREMQECRELLAPLRQLGGLRAVVRLHPGMFELGTSCADWFYETVDQWGAIFAPGSFRQAAS